MYGTDWQEIVSPDEDPRFTALSARLAALKAQRDAKYAERGRALHRLAHAGVEATFTVNADLALPPELHVAPFVPGTSYRAYVRFSNGNWERAKKDVPDIRGLSFKLLGVPGVKVLTGDASVSTQDFLLNQTSRTSARTPEEFVSLACCFAAGGQLTGPFRLIGELGLGRAVALIRGALAGMNQPFPSYQSGTFWSMVPFRFGPTAARFSLVPADPASPASPAAGGLTKGLEAALRAGPAWEFRVQLYQDATRTPIEDATVDWDSPWIPVARLQVTPVDLASPRGAAVSAFVERLAFDPWHAVEALRPLGAMNRLRKVAYYTASVQDRDYVGEPDGTERFDGA